MATLCAVKRDGVDRAPFEACVVKILLDHSALTDHSLDLWLEGQTLHRFLLFLLLFGLDLPLAGVVPVLVLDVEHGILDLARSQVLSVTEGYRW